jgi:hypothetical protein
LSQFTLPFYQKAMQGEAWNYYKVRNGSYREFTPDYYALGYMMIQYGNQSFTESTWDTILHHAPRYKNLIRPFSSQVKDHYGKYNKGLYLDAMQCYRDECNLLRVNDVEYAMVPISESDAQADFLDMTYPEVNGDGSIYTAITTFDQTTAIYHLQSSGQKKKIVSTGLQKDTYFDYSADRFVWTEIRNDPRWIRQDQNVIVMFDQRKGIKKTFRPEKGYFTPSLNAVGDRIVSLHVGVDGDYALRILDAEDGRLLRELPNPQNLYLGYPIFNEDETTIIATARNQAGQMCLVEQDIQTGTFRFITHYSYVILGRPVEHGPWIFLTTSLSPLNQVFAVDKEEGIFYQVSFGNNAHYQPSWDPVQDGIVCAQYRLDGQKLVRLPGQPMFWRLVNLDHGIKEFDGSTRINLLETPIRRQGFEVKKYSVWNGAINPHSWVVTSNDPVWGVEVRSNNVLNTVALTAGYEFNRDNLFKGPYVDLTFGMWFPQFSFGFSRISREVEGNEGNDFRRSLDQLHTGISLPLVFSPGVYQQYLSASIGYNAGVSKRKPAEEGQDFKFNYASYRFLLINSRKMAYRQSIPAFAQRVEVNYASQISGIPISQFYAAGDIALPAPFPAHYLSIQGEWLSQELSVGSIQLGNTYRGARGFPYVEGEKQYTVGLTYGFPVWYPDRGIGNIFYTKRIRLQPFYDVAYSDDPSLAQHWMGSTGMEVIVDFDFPPITLGLRYSRLLRGVEGSPNQFEFFIPAQRF